MIIDTSVAIKMFYEEEETQNALRIFDAIAGHSARAMVPDLLFYEFANVLKSKARVPGTDVDAAITTLHELPWEVVGPTAHLMSNALHIADVYDISVYDAAYVALAIEWDMPLITADKKLQEKVGKPLVHLLTDYET